MKLIFKYRFYEAMQREAESTLLFSLRGSRAQKKALRTQSVANPSYSYYSPVREQELILEFRKTNEEPCESYSHQSQGIYWYPTTAGELLLRTLF